MKMVKLSSNKKVCPVFYFFLIVILLSVPILSLPKIQIYSDKQLEDEITKALRKSIKCEKIEVRIEYNPKNLPEIKRLLVKIDGIVLEQFVADHMTLAYESPVIELNKLKKEKELKFLSYSKSKVSILASVESLEKYFINKANQFNKKNVRISIKFTPPYIECFYNVPASEITSESIQLLKPFIKQGEVEGYAAFKIEAKDNTLYAFSSKVITNHFLLPNAILKTFEARFNPFDNIPVVKPFQYNINNITVQSKYIFLTN